VAELLGGGFGADPLGDQRGDGLAERVRRDPVQVGPVRICRHRRSTLFTCRHVPFRVGETALCRFSTATERRRSSIATAKSGRATVLTLASDLGLAFRYVPLPGSVLIVPLMVTAGRGASRSMSTHRSARISPIRAPVPASSQ
jgi:hypothetical protein